MDSYGDGWHGGSIKLYNGDGVATEYCKGFTTGREWKGTVSNAGLSNSCVRSGSMVYLKNMYSSGSYVDTCGGSSCGISSAGTMSSGHHAFALKNKNSDRVNQDHIKWKLWAGNVGTCILENQMLYIQQNYYNNYLDTCQRRECSGKRGFDVKTAEIANRDGMSGSWQIQLKVSMEEMGVGSTWESVPRYYPELKVGQNNRTATAQQYQAILAEAMSSRAASLESEYAVGSPNTQWEETEDNSADAMSMSLTTVEMPGSLTLYLLAGIGATSLAYFGYQKACAKSAYQTVQDEEEDC